ncbi:MAG TPA: polysaccharide biosynthesis protein [Thiotrichales bacterium]|nr:polysaccharide biosynthesis protein [Thiotrichales bacterium]
MPSVKEWIRSRWAAIVHDLVMVLVAWSLAYWVRFNLSTIPEPWATQLLQTLPLVLLVQGGAFHFFGLYKGVWRFASLPDMVRILKALAAGLLGGVLVVYVLFSEPHVPRSIPLLYVLLLLPLISGPRLVYRLLRDYRYYDRGGKRVLVVGAGRSGEMLVRDLLRDPSASYQPVGFVDDDVSKHRREIQGVPVLGSIDAIPDLVTPYRIELLIVAMPSADAGRMQRIVEVCEGTGLPIRKLPGIQELESARGLRYSLRELSIEDLLGREQVRLDWEGIRKGLRRRSVLVTGAGGSIGAELCRQLVAVQPRELILFERSEYNLFMIERELRHHFPELTLHAYLGDVTDLPAVERVFAAHHPQVVFHAAAYKHVPMLENQLREAMRNNVIGTRIVAEATARFGGDEFVLISSDKAVNPVNVMGATKRLAELICQELGERNRTRFITVRFGNVLGSAGSVVPLFRAQIEAGGPVTVTDPEMTRYFMTIREACQLIMQAAVMGRGHEIFVLDMGEPVGIDQLARQMIQLAGKVPGEEIEIIYTGPRPGEKIREELFHSREELLETPHEKIHLARGRIDLPMRWARLLDKVDAACENFDEEILISLLAELVPEFQVGEEKRHEIRLVALPDSR